MPHLDRLLIALVKNVDDDVIHAVQIGAADQLRLDVSDILGKKSSDLWPDFGRKYRADDQEVLKGGMKLNIPEAVTVNGKEINVLTDKYAVRGTRLILVLVYLDEGSLVDEMQNFVSVSVKAPEGWIPRDSEDQPVFENTILSPIMYEGEHHETYQAALDACTGPNQMILDGGYNGIWYSVFLDSFFR